MMDISEADVNRLFAESDKELLGLMAWNSFWVRLCMVWQIRRWKSKFRSCRPCPAQVLWPHFGFGGLRRGLEHGRAIWSIQVAWTKSCEVYFNLESSSEPLATCNKVHLPTTSNPATCTSKEDWFLPESSFCSKLSAWNNLQEHGRENLTRTDSTAGVWCLWRSFLQLQSSELVKTTTTPRVFSSVFARQVCWESQNAFATRCDPWQWPQSSLSRHVTTYHCTVYSTVIQGICVHVQVPFRTTWYAKEAGVLLQSFCLHSCVIRHAPWSFECIHFFCGLSQSSEIWRRS